MPRKPNRMPPLQRLKEALHYDKETGIFIWIKPPKSHSHLQGGIAGSKRLTRHRGLIYLFIGLEGIVYPAQRLAYYYVTGEDPKDMVIDHINGDTLDNSFSNLRIATMTQNWANSKRMKNNTSGYKGVCWHKSCNKWMARICSGGKRTTLGFYDNPEDAHSAYITAANDIFGNFANAG